MYIDAVEGRLFHGVEQFRVRLASNENSSRIGWWWYGLSETAYQRNLAKMSEKGLPRPLYLQKFIDTNGHPRYQMVFRKHISP